ncbi:MAG: DUF4270 domain-containing protein, partial [Muribaculum sp.]|nr:DUF4270 domain-containing protein [Muribaculum sp.]
MFKKLIFPLAVSCVLALSTLSCDDEVSPIGGSIAGGEVSIQVDSLFEVQGNSVACPVFDSKTRAFMIGRLYAEDYGDLDCSFVAQLMPGLSMEIPDSIGETNLAGMKLRLQYSNDAFTGDSLMPQQLTVYRLNKQLPSDINSGFDVSGYYDEANPLGKKTFTASALGANDTVYKKSYRTVYVDMPREMAVDVFRQYRTNPSMFQWPAEFAKYFPGIYVKSTFGRGLVVNFTTADFNLYYRYKTKKSVT